MSHQRNDGRAVELEADSKWSSPGSDATYINGIAWIFRIANYRSRFRCNPPDWVAQIHWREQSSWMQTALDLDRPAGLSPDQWRNRRPVLLPKWADELRDEAAELLKREMARAHLESGSSAVALATNDVKECDGRCVGKQ